MSVNNEIAVLTLPTKCLIKSLDTDVQVEAMFNPKEIGIDRTVPWNKHKKSAADNPILEYTDPDSREMSIELLFDTFETKTSAYLDHIKPLEQLTKVVESLKRPPMVLFTWGNTFPAFMGVISQLGVKYTMFLTDGTPCRATVTLKIKEAEALAVKAKKGDSKAGKSYDEVKDPQRPDQLQPHNHRLALEGEPGYE